MPRYEKPGIYVEAKGASEGSFGPEGMLGYKHLYLIYRRADGTTEVLRGGPDDSKTPGNFFSLTTETGESISTSADRNPEFDRRPSRRLEVDGRDLEEVWRKMRNRVDEIGAAELRYDPLIPGDDTPELTSNSVIRAALEAAGQDPETSLPDGIDQKDVPGFENNADASLNQIKEKPAPSMPEEPAERIDGFGPHAEDSGSPMGNADDVSEAPEGVGLGVEVARNATEGKPGTDTGNAVPESARAKAMAIVTDQKEGKDGMVDDGSADDLDDLMLKNIDDLTETEAKALGQWIWKLPSHDPRRLEVEDRRREFYQLNFGNKPAAVDETGRIVESQPVRAVPEIPKGLATPNGELVANALQRVGDKLALPVRDDGVVNVVKALQTGLSQMGEKLKVDGVSGPKTKGALKRTIARHGVGKVEEAFGIGRFKRFAETERSSGGSASGLKATVEKDVQPLFGSLKPRVAAETLQESINDLNAKAADERRQPKPGLLKIDGNIGPRTTDAFRSALVQNGPEKLTKAYASMLGLVG